MLIHEKSKRGRRAFAQAPYDKPELSGIPQHMRRKTPPQLPEVSEMETVRHYTRLSQKNFNLDSEFYPLGSCAMKYNPRACDSLAMLPGFVARHPYAPASHSQGFLACMFELQEILKTVTGMKAVSLTPAAAAQGELAAVAMIRAYHDARGDLGRREILMSHAAQGTKSTTAVMCGFKIREIPTNVDGEIDVDALRAALSPKTAGIMLANPSTIGIFERRIGEIADLVHDVGGLLCYDGANLNAVLGKVKPGDIGVDVVHMNLLKIFSTPNGGGGPGAGPVGVSEPLIPFLPVPMVGFDGDEYQWISEGDRPQSIGPLSAFAGNAGVLLRAYVYARILGREGIRRVAGFSTLNANYMMKRMQAAGFEVALPARRASHAFVITLQEEVKQQGVRAMDFAKRLLDYGYHSPSTFCALSGPESLSIEATETQSIEAIDGFLGAMEIIKAEARSEPATVKGAPHTLPLRRLDDVRAAGELDLRYTARSRPKNVNRSLRN